MHQLWHMVGSMMVTQVFPTEMSRNGTGTVHSFDHRNWNLQIWPLRLRAKQRYVHLSSLANGSHHRPLAVVSQFSIYGCSGPSWRDLCSRPHQSCLQKGTSCPRRLLMCDDLPSVLDRKSRSLATQDSNYTLIPQEWIGSSLKGQLTTSYWAGRHWCLHQRKHTI